MVIGKVRERGGEQDGGLLGEQRHTVIGLLPVEQYLIAECGQFSQRKVRILNFGFLDTHYVRQGRCEPSRKMLDARYFEQMAYDLFMAGLVAGTSHLAIGQEAIAAGFAHAMRTGDLYADTQDWERATAEYRKLVIEQPGDVTFTVTTASTFPISIVRW